MKFIATLHPQSAQSRAWRSRRLRHGIIKGVRFDRAGATYHSAPLEPAELETLRPLHFIKIEVMTEPSAAAVEIPIAAAAPPAKPAPKAGKTARQISDDELFAPAKK